MKRLLLSIISSLSLAGCGPPLPSPAPFRPAVPPTAVPVPSSVPVPVAPTPGVPAPGMPRPASGAGPARPETRSVAAQGLGPAASALVRQARAQSAVGDFTLAAATLERALRMEPDHPRLWLELGEVRQAQHNYPQAEVMGRKALSAADDRPTQALAWRLIAGSLTARGLTREAAAASEKARQLDSSS